MEVLEPRDGMLSDIYKSINDKLILPARCALSPLIFPECTKNLILHPFSPQNWIDKDVRQRLEDMQEKPVIHDDNPSQFQGESNEGPEKVRKIRL